MGILLSWVKLGLSFSMQSFYLCSGRLSFAKLRSGMNVSFTDHDLMIILSLDGIDFDVVEAGKSTKSRSTNQALLGDWL